MVGKLSTAGCDGFEVVNLLFYPLGILLCQSLVPFGLYVGLSWSCVSVVSPHDGIDSVPLLIALALSAFL
jgi:hypothetical protein